MQNSIKFPEEIKFLPLLPGVYIMKGVRGEILYIGKATRLRDRVASYMHPRDAKTISLLKHVKELDFVVTSSEGEALLLENNFIKKHRPKYNIRLVDDENYPYIKITNDKYPRLLKAYRIKGKNGEYFGPFPHGKAIDLTIKAVRKIFPVRTCNLKIRDDKALESCLLYHLGLCAAPCAHKTSLKEYLNIVENLKAFLRGNSEGVIKKLQDRMSKAKDALEFEKAAIYRDQINGILSVMEKQRVVSERRISFDSFAVCKKRSSAVIVKLSVRNGRVISSYPFILSVPMKASNSQILEEFLLQHPFHGSFMKIYVPMKLPQQRSTEDFLSKKNHFATKISIPKGKMQKELLAMATQNAMAHLDNYIEKRKFSKEKKILEELKNLLGLLKLPVRIEGYDISNISGMDSVGSMVVFTNGKPDKNQYRRFKIKFVKGPNDYAMLKEVLFRRFKENGDSFANKKPNLLLIDGGKGQLDAAIKIKKLLKLDVSIASLAKKEELIFFEDMNGPIRLPRSSEVLKLLQCVRDESHRFAKAYFTKLHGYGILKKEG